jgi:hypothetical protein
MRTQGGFVCELFLRSFRPSTGASSAPRRPRSTPDLLPEGVDYAFDAIGKAQIIERAIRMLDIGGAAVRRHPVDQ